MTETFINIFTQYISPQLVVLVLSAMPMIGLHGGFVAAALLGVPWQQTLLLTIVGNIIPIPFLLLFIRKVFELMHRSQSLGKIAQFFEDKALRKAAALAEKYPVYTLLGLFIFVVVPIPGSGAWTGSLIAVLMKLPARKAFIAISLGVVASCIIMVLLIYGVPAAIGYESVF